VCVGLVVRAIKFEPSAWFVIVCVRTMINGFILIGKRVVRWSCPRASEDSAR